MKTFILRRLAALELPDKDLHAVEFRLQGHIFDLLIWQNSING